METNAEASRRDVPVSFVIDAAPFRFGAEVGARGLVGPTSVHGGVSVGFFL